MGYLKAMRWWRKERMDNLLFQDKNQSYTVKFDTKAYEQMLYYCAISNPYETGGILIGNYSSNQAIANILQITPPPQNSRETLIN